MKRRNFIKGLIGAIVACVVPIKVSEAKDKNVYKDKNDYGITFQVRTNSNYLPGYGYDFIGPTLETRTAFIKSLSDKDIKNIIKEFAYALILTKEQSAREYHKVVTDISLGCMDRIQDWDKVNMQGTKICRKMSRIFK